MLKKNNFLIFTILTFSCAFGFSQDPNPCNKADEGIAVVVFSTDSLPHKLQIRTCESVHVDNKVELKPVGALSAIQLKDFLKTRMPGNSVFKCFGTLGNADNKDAVIKNLDSFVESQRSINMSYGPGYKYFDPLILVESDLNLAASNYRNDGTTQGSITSDVIKANQDINRIKCAQRIVKEYNESFENSDLVFVPLYKIMQESGKKESEQK